MTGTATVTVDDVELTSKHDYVVVRLANGDALEIWGRGEANLYVKNGSMFSRKVKIYSKKNKEGN